ncbi:hypothetical protein [Pseudomonas sp. R5(2019)]|uniref:hypothetical protein n=1 Tax=Pseudomonas sp. R5(2019) TaxID=2697566 RepID=UPI001412610B|nr:hypothetical protein [Pseudomonas sp. R5(2019)]NBA96533.1 hypothetical protein [Pseudomonas sp. R5(2019)]
MNPSLSIDRLSRRKQHSPAGEQSVSAITQKVSAVLVLPLALVLLFAGACMIVAGIASYQAEAFISDWEKAGNEPEARAWQIAHDAAQRATSLYPVANGDYLDRLGRIHSWQQFRQPYAAPTAASSRHAALDAYRAAVAARPSWPYTWAHLAHSKLYLQEFDDEFAHALSQAFQLGPWRIGVNRELAEIGFSAWPHLSESQRQTTLESARRSIAYGHAEAQRLLKIAQHTDKLPQLCGSLSRELINNRKLSPCLN